MNDAHLPEKKCQKRGFLFLGVSVKTGSAYKKSQNALFQSKNIAQPPFPFPSSLNGPPLKSTRSSHVSKLKVKYNVR